MRAAVVLAFCAGCSEVFGLASPQRIDAFEPEPCLQDRFNDATIDATLWTVSASTGSTIEETGGQLVFTLPTDAAQNVVGTVNPIDISTATVQIELVKATEQSLDATTRFFVGTDMQHYLQLQLNDNKLVARTVLPGVDDTVTRLWDPVAFRFWAVAYDAATETATFATSPNGTTWNPMRTIQVALASNVRVELGVNNALMTGTAPGQARFDNFLVLTPDCAP